MKKVQSFNMKKQSVISPWFDSGLLHDIGQPTSNDTSGKSCETSGLGPTKAWNKFREKNESCDWKVCKRKNVSTISLAQRLEKNPWNEWIQRPGGLVSKKVCEIYNFLGSKASKLEEMPRNLREFRLGILAKMLENFVRKTCRLLPGIPGDLPRKTYKISFVNTWRLLPG